MKSIIIDGHEARDIDKQLQEVPRGLGNPEPPLNLDEVLELQNLDRGYYSSPSVPIIGDTTASWFITVEGEGGDVRMERTRWEP